jgi:hypothetical protein
MKSFFKDLHELWKYFFGEYIPLTWYLFRQSLRMNMAIHLADLKQKAYNKQYHIMLFAPRPGVERLVTINNNQINEFRRKKWLPKNADKFTLRRSFFYSTPLSRNNRATSEERMRAREKYMTYCKSKFNL